MAFDPATGYRQAMPDEARVIREEVADVIGLSPTERARLLALACRAGRQLLDLKSVDARRRILEHRDPLSAEAEQVLERMRRAYQARRP